MIEAAALATDQDPCLGHYLGEWLAHTRGRVRATTYQGYESLVRCYALPAIGEIGLSELTPLHLQRLYSSLLVPERRLSAGTVLNFTSSSPRRSGRPCAGGSSPRTRPRAPSRPGPFAPSRWLSIRLSLQGSSRPFRARRSNLPECSRSRPGCAEGRSWPFVGRTSVQSSPWPRSGEPFTRRGGACSSPSRRRGDPDARLRCRRCFARSSSGDAPSRLVAVRSPGGGRTSTS